MLQPLVLLVVFLVCIHVSLGQDVSWVASRGEGQRICSVDELLPDPEGNVSDGWSARSVDVPPFNCSCPSLKSSYFCPSYEFAGYPVWEPAAVAEGQCETPSFDQLAEGPLPPDFRVLVHGNSHLRQVVEGIACMFQDTVQSRLVSFMDNKTGQKSNAEVDRGLQCRGCVGSDTRSGLLLESYHCVAEGSGPDACRCDDNTGTYVYPNGARLDYYFAHRTENKTVGDALEPHGTEFKDYSIVIANAGNPPSLRTAALLESAREIAEAGVPFIWLSTYDDVGSIQRFSQKDRGLLRSLGVKFLPVHAMVEGLDYLTRGFIEGETNSHYCMPGPPNEIALLLLRVMWSLWSQSVLG